MEDLLTYQDQIEQLLEKKREYLEDKGLKKLRNGFQAFQIYYENLYNILMRKGLIQEDPYKYDENITEIKNPVDDSFIESEKQEKMSQRLSSYHSQLEFLNNYYQYNLDFLDLRRLKKIIAFTKYINWFHISESSPGVTTRTVAEYFGKIRKGTDTLSAGIISDSLVQVEKTLKIIYNSLSDIAAFHKEAYKLEMRKRVFSLVKENAPIAKDKSDVLLQKVKKIFSRVITNKPFYPELINEIIQEDYLKEGNSLRKKILDTLAVIKDKKNKEEKGISFKDILIQAVKYLGSCGLQVEDAFVKLCEGQQALENREMGLIEKLKRWLIRIIKGGEDILIYEIEYFDVITSTTKTEKIDFNEYGEDVKKVAKIFAGIMNKASQIFRRLETSSEERIFEFLNKYLADIQLVHRRMNGLIIFFKSEMPKDKRSKIRGIKLELNAIKNSIIKANQKKHEYVSIKEEEEQMKRLGLKKG